MKKYRVLKELPGAPVGTITNLGSRKIGFQNWSESCIGYLIKDKWIEEVKNNISTHHEVIFLNQPTNKNFIVREQ